MIETKESYLSFIEYVESTKKPQALYRCVCGGEVVRYEEQVTSGKVKSCGCYAKQRRKNSAESKVGKKFGKLLVTSLSPTEDSSGFYLVVVCECGSVFEAKHSELYSGKIKHCGCLDNQVKSNLDKYVKKMETRRSGISYTRSQLEMVSKVDSNIISMSKFKQLLRSYKKGAASRNHEFALSDATFLHLISSNCHYCGASPSNNHKGFRYSGIDRVDNSIGYVESNVVSCCIKCNRAKSAMDREDFVHWVSQVYRHLLSSGLMAGTVFW